MLSKEESALNNQDERFVDLTDNSGTPSSLGDDNSASESQSGKNDM